MYLFRGDAIPFERLAWMLIRSMSLGAHYTEIHLCLDLAVIGKRNPFFKREVIIAPPISDDAGLEISLDIGWWFIQGC